MADVNANKYVKFGGGFTGERFEAKLVYDFAEDGSATADQVLLGEAEGDVMIDSAIAYVETTCTSGGSAVVNIGVLAGDVDAMLANTAGAVASLTAGTTVKETAGQKLKMASGEKIAVDVATAALTAGKICVYVSGVKL